MTATRGALISILSVALCGVAVRAQTPGPGGVAPDAEIRKIIGERVDTYRQSVGIVVGVIEPSGRRIVTHGRAAAGAAMPLDGDTLFEIGSMSKVFTSLLLADAVQRGEVALTDPITKFLPPTVKVPERGRAITLQDLSTHISGLPRLPDMNPKDPENPYADYSVEQLYQFLSTYQLPRDVGASYDTRIWGRAARPCAGTASRHRLRIAREDTDHWSARHDEYQHHVDASVAGHGSRPDTIGR